MKYSPGFSTARAPHRAAFTLIELLAVMAIILVLAGLILNIAGSAQYNSAKARATGEIKAFETALESYKTDNGAYPRNAGSTDTLDAQQNTDPGGTAASATLYQKSSESLYQALSGFTPTTTGSTTTFTVGKPYMTFQSNQLHLASDADAGTTVVSPTSPYMYIMDPFGFSYGYSTIYLAKLDANSSSTTAATPTPSPAGYNPTFDLWSTGGYASGGKSTPRNLTGTTASIYSSLWIKNW